MSVSEDVLKALREIGLTEYECNAYLALVDGGKMSASDASSKSGVPYSRIYDVLGRLETRGFIRLIKERPTKYEAKSPKEIVRLVRITWEERLDRAGKQIVEELQPRFEQETPATTRDVWLLHGREAILARAEEILELTRDELLLSLPSFDTQTQDISSVIEIAMSIKAKVKILTSEVSSTLRDVVPDNFEIRVRDRVFGAGIVSDRKHTLIMLAEAGDGSDFLGIYSSHVIFAAMASAYFQSLWKDSEEI